MSTLTWKPEYALGLPIIDTAHQKLISIMSSLQLAIKNGRGSEILAGLLLELEKYTRTHFAGEEQLMKRHGYPDLAAHQAAHRNFVDMVVEHKQGVQSGRVALSISLAMFLTDWLVTHIQKTDRQYMSHVQPQG